MSKILSSLPSTWSKFLPLLSKRCLATEITGSWNEAPLCKGRQMLQEEEKCHPKQVSCSGRLSACGKTDWPECGKPDVNTPEYLKCCCSKNLSRSPCEKTPEKKRKREEKKPFKSMWETCGIEQTCPALVARLDDTHYVPSNKITRIYTQTWKTCEPMIRKRKICCFNEMCMLPPTEMRPKKKCPKTAMEQDSEQLKVDYNVLKKCLENVTENPNTKKINKCRKIVMPCCRKVAKTVKCHHNRMQSKCLKECCPHPSFSECDHPSLKGRPPVECRCSHFDNQCESNRFAIRKKQFNIPPPLPAWPPKERPK